MGFQIQSYLKLHFYSFAYTGIQQSEMCDMLGTVPISPLAFVGSTCLQYYFEYDVLTPESSHVLMCVLASVQKGGQFCFEKEREKNGSRQ